MEAVPRKGVKGNILGWQAQYHLNRKTVYVGYFKTEQEAREAADQAREDAYAEYEEQQRLAKAATASELLKRPWK